jgi:nitrite reductase/ring-hydroxylating ferredoxin subunit
VLGRDFNCHGETISTTKNLVRVAALDDVQARGRLAVHVEGYNLALFASSGQVYAVDNRCPHMGFPLERGSLNTAGTLAG